MTRWRHYNNFVPVKTLNMKSITKYSGLMLLCISLEVSAQLENFKPRKMKTNKEKAIAINKAVQDGDVESAAALVMENYIQHTPTVPGGKRGLEILITKIKNKEIPAPKINNVRSFEDGEFVVLHHDVMWPNRKAMFEIFRFKNGLAAEHWSGIADHPEKTVNGHSMLDGATEITDQILTEKNKEFAASFVQTVLIDGRFDKLSEFYHPEIVQHNPFIDNTVPGLLKGVEELERKGVSIEIKKIFKVLGEGNFVLVCSEGKFADKYTAFFDLFRLQNGILRKQEKQSQDSADFLFKHNKVLKPNRNLILYMSQDSSEI
jgi:predicted SnoaL-like aldol condensation-catalyzing enzyme